MSKSNSVFKKEEEKNLALQVQNPTLRMAPFLFLLYLNVNLTKLNLLSFVSNLETFRLRFSIFVGNLFFINENILSPVLVGNIYRVSTGPVI